MENRLYLEAEMTNFNSKIRFEKSIKFYYEIWVGYLQKGLKPYFVEIEIIGNSEALLTKVYGR
jgi:hypothetical protein